MTKREFKGGKQKQNRLIGKVYLGRKGNRLANPQLGRVGWLLLSKSPWRHQKVYWYPDAGQWFTATEFKKYYRDSHVV